MAKEIIVNRKKFIAKWPLILEGIANDFMNVLVMSAPVSTGNLKNQITLNKTARGYEISMPMYAIYLEFGTPPHIIRPRTKKALSWTEGKGGGGKRFFAKIVHHPGTDPQPFIRPAFDLHLPDIIKNNIQRHLS